MDSSDVLLIILSVLLAFFLILSIALTAILIRIAQQIKRVTSSAERTVTGVENLAATLGKGALPAAVAKVVFEQFKQFARKKK